jgi:hypothetical protein
MVQYNNIDQDTVENDTLKGQARGFEERAILQEYEAARFEALGEQQPQYTASLETQKEQAAAARREADAFVKAAKKRKQITDEELNSLRRDVLTRTIQSIEQQHAQSMLIRKVREEAGLPVPDRDTNIEDLETSWEVCKNMLGNVPADPQANRAGRRAAVKGAAKSTTAKSE